MNHKPEQNEHKENAATEERPENIVKHALPFLLLRGRCLFFLVTDAFPLAAYVTDVSVMGNFPASLATHQEVGDHRGTEDE
jgi:hypothetical protein